MCRKLVYLVAFVMLLGVVGSVSADSLAAHWKLDEGTGSIAFDSSVNSNDGTLTNMSEDDWGQQACPELGSSLDFDGNDDHIVVPDDPSIGFGSGSFSVTYWMYSPAGTGGEQIHKGTSVAGAYSGKRYATALSGGAIYFTIDDNVAKQWTATSVPDLPGVWHHVACYRDGINGSVHIRIDGDAASANSGGGFTGDIDSPGEDLFICRRGPDETPNSFPGKLSDIRIYDYMLSEAEILDLAKYESLVPWCPDPTDGAQNVALNSDLSWAIPTDANEMSWTYEIYFDTDSTFASTTPLTAGPLSEGENRASLTNAQVGGPLAVDTYYWRVDAIDPNEFGTVTRTGDTWTFDAGAALPVLIAPANTQVTGVEINVDLEWSSDPLVTASRVIITPGGGSENDRGIQASPYNPYNDAGVTIEWNTSYEWRVEELDAGSNILAVGPTWGFRVRALDCIGMAADIDGSADCIVNLADFAMMSSEWLDCNWNDGGMASPCP